MMIDWPSKGCQGRPGAASGKKVFGPDANVRKRSDLQPADSASGTFQNPASLVRRAAAAP
jgi:hypothetical protein